MKGFSVIEIVIGAALVAVVVAAIATAWQFYVKISGQSVRLTQASLILEEGSEVVQYWRDKGWTANIASLAQNTPYYVVWNGSDYVASATAIATNGTFARTIAFSPVYRDASQNIATSGTLDPDTLLVTLNVYPATTTSPALVTAQMLIHDLFSN